MQTTVRYYQFLISNTTCTLCILVQLGTMGSDEYGDVLNFKTYTHQIGLFHTWS